jgi:signal transduction histidine kinase
MKNLSLTFKIVFIVTLFIIGFNSYFSYSNLKYVKESIKQSETQKVDIILNTITPLIAINLSYDMKEGVLELLNTLTTENHNILSVTIQDEQKKKLFQRFGKAFRSDAMGFTREKKIVDPMIGDPLGTITVRYSNVYYEAVLADYRMFLWGMLAFLTVVILLLILYLRHLIAPLKALADTLVGFRPRNTITLEKLQGSNEITVINNAALLMMENINHYTEELHLLNTSLEEKVKQRTAEVEKKNRELHEAIDNLKRTQQQLVETEKMASLASLIAGVSHEINTPVGIGVTAISNLHERVEKIHKDYAAEKMTKSQFEEFLDSAKQLSDMTLLNLGRASEQIKSFKQVAVDQSSEERRTFGLYDYLQDILLSLKPKLKKTRLNIELDCPEDLEVNSYPGAFSQIFTNLIMNSLIHGYNNNPEIEGTITITAASDGDQISVRYSDDGKGIDPSILSKIFDPFFTTNRAEGGSGLGLHIIYNIVTRQLGGQIRCESEPDKGVTFSFTIPIKERT